MVTTAGSTVPDVLLAGERIALPKAVARLRAYPSRTPSRYDVLPGTGPYSDEELLTRTRALSSRLSKQQAAAMADRARDAEWGKLPSDASLADTELHSPTWEAADKLYLRFLKDKIAGVSFAKVHKFLHLKHPTFYPIIDGRVRARYAARQRALIEPTGLTGYMNWRRRTWIAIGQDLKDNASRGVFAALRAELDSTTGDRQHVARQLAQVSDVRLLDALAWKL